MYSTLFSAIFAGRLRLWFSSRRRPPSQGRRESRPSLECLEDRCVPAVLQVGTSATYHTITSALLAAKPGDTVRVQPGTYQEAVNITTKNITLEGVNQSAVIEAPADLSANGYALVNVNGATGVTIKNFTIEGTYTGGFTNVNGNLLGLHAGIFVSNGGSATITGNLITDIRDATPNTTNDDGFAILIGSESTVLHTTGSAVIQNNTIENYQQAGVTIGGAGSSATIQNNAITGLSLTLANQYLEQLGIVVQPGGTARILGNTVSNNVQTYAGNFAVGIYLDGSQGSASAVGNTVTDNNTGIYVYSVQGGTIGLNQVTGNIDYGILLSSTVGTVVTGNTVTGNATGIFVFSGQGGVIAFNQVSDNTNDGIDLFSTSGVTLVGNVVNGNSGTGISLFSSTKNVFLLNGVKNSGFDGFFVDSGSTGNVFGLNNLSGNGFEDAQDLSTGSGTSGTGNTYLFNSGRPVNQS